MGFVKEFKEFAMRGNVIDLAVGVIIGGAFGKVTSSMVEDVMMPPLGALMNGADFSKLVLTISEPDLDTTGVAIAGTGVVIKYGQFINVMINFIIVAFAVFLLIKALNSMKKKEAAAPSAPPAPTTEEKLLGEIRDLLAKKA